MVGTHLNTLVKWQEGPYLSARINDLTARRTCLEMTENCRVLGYMEIAMWRFPSQAADLPRR